MEFYLIQHVSDDIRTAITLAGCSSNSPFLPKAYIIKLQYQKSPGLPSPSIDGNLTGTDSALFDHLPILEVFAGYFGICVTYNGTNIGCAREVNDDTIRVPDVFALRSHGDNFRKNCIVSYLL